MGASHVLAKIEPCEQSWVCQRPSHDDGVCERGPLCTAADPLVTLHFERCAGCLGDGTRAVIAENPVVVGDVIRAITTKGGGGPLLSLRVVESQTSPAGFADIRTIRWGVARWTNWASFSAAMANLALLASSREEQNSGSAL